MFRTHGLVGRSPVPALRAANLFFPPRSIIAEAASRMRHNYAVMFGARAMQKIRPYSLEHDDEGEASPKVSIQPADRLDWRNAVCCLNLEEAHLGSSYLGYVL